VGMWDEAGMKAHCELSFPVANLVVLTYCAVVLKGICVSGEVAEVFGGQL
jgi:hypothetical protein